jgi:hypothetical protein
MATSKDYWRVADAIRDTADGETEQGVVALYRLAMTIARRFTEDNPRFDYERFMDATGVQGGLWHG